LLHAIFVQRVTTTLVYPFASLKEELNVTLSTTLPYDIYGDSVTYQCRYEGLQTRSTAILNGNSFTCPLDFRSIVTSRITNVTVWIISKAQQKELPLTFEEVFYFMKFAKLQSIYPFIGKQTDSIIPITLITDSSDILTTRGLYCKYITDGIVGFSKA